MRVVSLFSGCGGGDLGLRGGFEFLGESYDKLPFKTVYANEIDKRISNIFMDNFNIDVDVRDIRDVDSEEIPEHDVLVGGFPCVTFSIVAQNPKRLGIKDDTGKLFYEMIRVINEKKPKAFIAENVKGILSANKGEAFPLIIEEFEKCGYKVSHRLLNSSHYGVPQNRERVFIVGTRKDLEGDYIFPEPTHYEENSLIGTPFNTLQDVIFKEEEIHERYYFSERAVQGMLRARKDMNKGRAQDITKPCNTVGAHLEKMSLNSTDPVLKINGKYRRFTPREVARIQSFPDNYQLIEAQGIQYRALGNAIPPVLMWHVANQLKRFLKKQMSISKTQGLVSTP